MTFYNHDSAGRTLPQPVSSFDIPDTKVRLNDVLPEGLTEYWTTRHLGYLSVSEKKDMLFELGLAVAGKARVWIDGKMVLELWEEQEPGEFYYGCVSKIALRYGTDGFARFAAKAVQRKRL